MLAAKRVGWSGARWIPLGVVALATGLGAGAGADTRGASVSEDAPLVAVGEVGADRALVWVRAPGAERVEVALHAGNVTVTTSGRLDAERDHTVHLPVRGLSPATRYRYRATLRPDGRHLEGHFATAPATHVRAPLRFAFGGDVGGQNVCRDTREGMPIFRGLDPERLDFFLGLGDMIYADGVCEATGFYGNAQVPGGFDPASDAEGFRAHWRYNRADAGLRALLRATPYYAMWDDHEVVNDFGPHHQRGAHAPEVPLLALGLQAFLDHNPLAPPDEPSTRLYRRVRWGRHAELFLLDNRQYRDANSAADGGDAPKTQLGPDQRVWLHRGIATSDATWLLVASSVPVAIPTGNPAAGGRDGWAAFDQPTGFSRELRGILEAARKHRRRLLVLTTDVHFATAFRYRPFDDEFVFHELVVGPMNAGIFPKREVDHSLRPVRLFFHGPESVAAVTSWEEAKRWFNTGFVEIDARGHLRFGIRGVDGAEIHAHTLAPGP